MGEKSGNAENVHNYGKWNRSAVLDMFLFLNVIRQYCKTRIPLGSRFKPGTLYLSYATPHNRCSHKFTPYPLFGCCYLGVSTLRLHCKDTIRESGNRDCGRTIPFLGIHKWDFRCSAELWDRMEVLISDRSCSRLGKVSLDSVRAL
jgi:hypothetical protein